MGNAAQIPEKNLLQFRPIRVPKFANDLVEPVQNDCTARLKASGSRAMTLRSTSAGPLTIRRFCSHLR